MTRYDDIVAEEAANAVNGVLLALAEASTIANDSLQFLYDDYPALDDAVCDVLSALEDQILNLEKARKRVHI